MPRKPSPDAVPYLRLILGISMGKRLLSVEEQNRLDFSEALIEFIIKSNPRKAAMSAFIKEYMNNKGAKQSWCYKVKKKLQEITIIKWDEHWQEYRYNPERWKRDVKAMKQFKAQVGVWD